MLETLYIQQIRDFDSKCLGSLLNPCTCNLAGCSLVFTTGDSIMLCVHSSILSAAAILAVGERVVSVKWNETTKQTKREAAVLIGFESLSAPEVPENFRALVESALVSSAEDVLKKFCSDNPNSFEISANCFTRENLVESFISRGNLWLGKKELEIAFTGSATWKRIASRPEFSSNKTYQAVANRFKETILKLSGKATVISPEDADQILCKIEDSDLETNFGEFIVNRLESMKNRKQEQIDFASL